MQHIRQPNPWEHLGVFSDCELLRWMRHYTDRLLPESKKRIQDAAKDHKRNENMLAGLEAEAKKRGLL